MTQTLAGIDAAAAQSQRDGTLTAPGLQTQVSSGATRTA